MASRAHNRDVTYRKAKRKQKIAESYWPEGWYSNLHQYSKNKIHCSCPMCSPKSKNKGSHKNYYPAHNWSISDLRKIQTLEYEEQNEET